MPATRKNHTPGPGQATGAGPAAPASGTTGSRPGRPGANSTGEGNRSGRRARLVMLAGELFAQKGYRATTVREIADAAGILSGSLYHHFDSKESIADEILSSFVNEVLANYREAAGSADSPRSAIEQIVRSTSHTLSQHRAALAMLQHDFSYFATQARFGYLPKALREIERIWMTQLDLGKKAGLFRADLDAKLTYRLLRDVLWIPEQWRRTRGYTTDQVVDAFLRILFDGIAAGPATPFC